MTTKVKNVVKLHIGTIEVEYESILAQEKALSDRKTALQEVIRSQMDRTGSETFGRFQRQIRKSYSWKTDDIKALFPKKWIAFVKPDAALLKIEMTDVPELLTLAQVKQTEAIVLTKA